MKETEKNKLEKAINNAVDALRCGKLVVFPTETVYGLGADAANVNAVRHIFKVKQRPLNHPLIVHLPNISYLEHWASEINSAAWRLAQQFWPGPLTLIVKRASHVLDEVTGGQSTVGLRVPEHPVAQALLHAFNGGIAAPSANRFGYISATSASHVQKELGNEVDMILDGGNCPVGIESTIVDVSCGQAKILRLGAITPEAINAVTECTVADHTTSAVRAPGALTNHYAPNNPLYVLPVKQIDFAIQQFLLQKKRIAVLTLQQKRHDLDENMDWILMPHNAKDYARVLYANLRKIDAQKPTVILVEAPPNEMEWFAVRDRLEKARFKKPTTCVGRGIFI